jgi:hypothetical protein
MPSVKLEPTKEHPVPYDTAPEKPATVLEEMAVAANTVNLQRALGVELGIDASNMEQEKALIKEVVEKKKVDNLAKPNTAFAAAAFLSTYGSQLAMDVASARAAITNKLMEIANCGDPRYELKALELLGKHSDIGIFTERSEITVNYKDPEALENQIKERVKRLLNASVVSEVSISESLDDKLGVLEVVKVEKQEIAEVVEVDDVEPE